MEKVLISVVIASRNRSTWLLECLHSLEKQTLGKGCFEVIVVNDGSDDDTLNVLEGFSSHCEIKLNIINQENHGVSYARNAGVKAASGPLVAFTDDDCILPFHWLQTIVAEFANLPARVVGVGGPLNSFTDADNRLVGRFVRYLDEFNYIPVLGSFRVYPVHVSKLTGNEIVPYLRTSNAAFRKKALLGVQGFDQEFRRPGGEDPDLSYRLLAAGYSLKFLSCLVVCHHTRDSFTAYFKSVRNYVHGDFRKALKKEQYRELVIRRSYSCLLIQKVVSTCLALIGYPRNFFRAKKEGFSTPDAVLFPLLLLASKFYAIWVAIQCQLGFGGVSSFASKPRT